MSSQNGRRAMKPSRAPEAVDLESEPASDTRDGTLSNMDMDSDSAEESAASTVEIRIDRSRLLPELSTEGLEQLIGAASTSDAPASRRRGGGSVRAGRVKPRRKVIGNQDSRAPITDTSKFPFSAICQLEIDWVSKQSEIGTGCLIAPRLVLTAAHCVFDRNNQQFARQITVAPGRNGTDRVTPQATRKLFVNRFYPRVSNQEKPQFDYAAILLDEPFGVGEFGVGVYGDEDFQGETFNVVGYPFDKPNGTMWGHAQPVSVLGSRTLEYVIDTEAGQSGAPLFDVDTVDGQSQYIVVAVHSGFSSSGRNIAARITEEVWENLEVWMSKAQ